jgi:hypothetical protein
MVMRKNVCCWVIYCIPYKWGPGEQWWTTYGLDAVFRRISLTGVYRHPCRLSCLDTPHSGCCRLQAAAADLLLFSLFCFYHEDLTMDIVGEVQLYHKYLQSRFPRKKKQILLMLNFMTLLFAVSFQT